MDLLRRFRRRVKVEITCGCGDAFIPGAYSPHGTPRAYGCDTCGMKVRLSTFREPISW